MNACLARTVARIAALVLAGAASGAEPKRIFLARDCGAVGDGAADDRPALQGALDAAVAAGVPAAVRLEAGRVYRLGTNAASVAALTLRGATNVALEGCGATLLAHPATRALVVYRSRSIALRDFVIDCDPLPYTQGRILALSEGGLRFAPDPAYPAPVVAGPERYIDHKSSDAVFIAGATRLFNHEWRRISAVAPAGPNAFDVRFHAAGTRKLTATRAGDFIAIKILQPGAPLPRDADGRFVATGSANVQVRFSKGVTLENITSHAAPGMTLVATGSEDVSVRGLRIVRKPGTDRLVAGCSDGAHMKCLTRMPRFHDCEFEALMDDSINIKVSAERVEAVGGRAVRLSHADIVWDDIVLAPGDEVEWIDAGETAFLGLSRVEGVRGEGYRRACATFDRVPQDLKPGDLAFLRPQTAGVVSNCQFRTQLKTALLVTPQARVSDCRFENVAYGVHAMLGGGVEGPAPRDLDVRRCSFFRPWVAGVALSVKGFAAVPPDVAGVRIADCAFTLGRSGAALSGRYPEVVTSGIVLRAEEGRDTGTGVRLQTLGARRPRVLSSNERQAVEACLARIRACQLPDGAFAQVAPGASPRAPVWIAPYFAHFAALALLAGHERSPRPDDLARVGRWLSWCAKHQAPAGYWTDREGTAAAYADTGKVDAWDSSAALYLRVLDGCRRAGGQVPAAWLDAARRSAACIESLTDGDGLTWAKPDYRVKFLMDNIEVRAGWRAAAALFAAAGEKAGADRAGRREAQLAAERLPAFWQREAGHFAHARLANGAFAAGAPRPYPHGLAQLYGIAFVQPHGAAWSSVNRSFEPDAGPSASLGPEWWLAAAAGVSEDDARLWRLRVCDSVAAFDSSRTYLHRHALSALALIEGNAWLSP